MLRRASAIALLLILATLWRPGSVSAVGSLTVAPASGPPGTVFAVTGSGFTAISSVRVIVFYAPRSASGGRGERHVLDQQVAVGGDGGFTLRVDSTGFVPEEYVVIDAGVSAQARATFTVTDGIVPPPGLPNTGGGVARHRFPVGGVSRYCWHCPAWRGWRGPGKGSASNK